MIAGIVLAAGASSRLGRPKQLVSLGGKPLLAWVLDTMRETELGTIVLVLGHEAEAIQSTLNLDAVTVLVNTHHAEGMSTSLRAGLEAMGPDVEGAIVTMGDQPFISPSLIEGLIARFRQSNQPIVAADFGDYQGPPMLLGRAVWPLAQGISGDQGARFLLKTHPNWVATVPVSNGDASLDVDTEQGFATAVTVWKRMTDDSRR